MVCNSGVSLTPVVEGRTLQFGHRGLVNGLSVLGDHETGSYWDHITGECISGPLVGRRLPIAPLLHETAASASARHDGALIAISRPSLFGRFMGRVAEWTRVSKRGFLPPGFRGTMESVDARLPEMTLGLGIWNDRAARFYPLDQIRRQTSGLTDRLGAEVVQISVDVETRIPAAVHVEQEADIRSNGADGARSEPALPTTAAGSGFPEAPPRSRPMQLFTRWYGFVLTFPNCEIYGG